MSQQNEALQHNRCRNTGNKRMRTNNGKQREDYQDKDKEKQASTYSNYRIQSKQNDSYYSSYDEITQTMLTSSKEMNALLPDTATMVKQLQAEGQPSNATRYSAATSSATKTSVSSQI